MNKPPSVPPSARWRTRWQRARRPLSLLVALVCLAGVARLLGRQDWPAVLAAMRAVPADQLALAALAVGLSFTALIGYDLLGLHLAGCPRPPLPVVARASFTGFVLAMNFGFSVVSGGAVRAWYYGRAGIGVGGVARTLAWMAVTFLLGWVGLFGLTLLVWPLPWLSAQLGWAEAAQRALGALLLGGLAAYLGLCARGRPLGWRTWRWTPPRLPLALLQVGVSVLDACIAGAVLHVLLPAPGVAFLPFMGAYVTAVFAGMVSQVPGGLGVIELTLTLLLADSHTPETLLGTLLVYRLLAFIAPLVPAAAILAWDLTRTAKGPPPPVRPA